MPNTLAHIGVHGLLMRFGCRWPWALIYAGAIIPDIPWIALRVLKRALPQIDPSALILYSAAQSSLLSCMLLCALLALFLSPRIRSFVILLSGAALHLGIDALQTKWSNGVLLTAPFDWTLCSLGLAWPEHWIFVVLTALGLAMVVISLVARRWPQTEPTIVKWPGYLQLMLAAALLALYLLCPIPQVKPAFRANLYHSTSLAQDPKPTDHFFTFDRAKVRPSEGEAHATLYNGESVVLDNLNVSNPQLISLQGRFTSEGRFHVDAHHFPRGRTRDMSAIAGLLCLLVYFGKELYTAKRLGGPIQFL